MERRSERLALLKNLKPISYWESRVKRVFKKIRRKHQSAAVESKKGTKSLKDKSPQSGWSGSNSEDSVEPCCSKYLVDRTHLLAQRSSERAPLVKPKAGIMVSPRQELLVLVEAGSKVTPSTALELAQSMNKELEDKIEPWAGKPLSMLQEVPHTTGESAQRPVMMIVAFVTFLFLLGIFYVFSHGLHTPSDDSKWEKRRQQRRQNEALQQNLQNQIAVFRRKVTWLQHFADALVKVHDRWEIQNHLYLQAHGSKIKSKYIPKEDFALKSAGATVVKSSKSYNTGAKVCMLGFCWDYSRSPEVILERDNAPGNCWAMDGSEGYIIVKLSRVVCPTSVTLDHISKTVSHTEDISSAPQNFSVCGFKEDFEKEEGDFLGSFVYRIDGFPMQTFPLEGAYLNEFKYLLLKISSNWNHPNYTCIYGFHVYND